MKLSVALICFTLTLVSANAESFYKPGDGTIGLPGDSLGVTRQALLKLCQSASVKEPSVLETHIFSKPSTAADWLEDSYYVSLPDLSVVRCEGGQLPNTASVADIRTAPIPSPKLMYGILRSPGDQLIFSPENQKWSSSPETRGIVERTFLPMIDFFTATNPRLLGTTRFLEQQVKTLDPRKDPEAYADALDALRGIELSGPVLPHRTFKVGDVRDQEEYTINQFGLIESCVISGNKTIESISTASISKNRTLFVLNPNDIANPLPQPMAGKTISTVYADLKRKVYGLALQQQDGHVFVAYVNPGSAGAKAGIQPRTQVRKINGIDLAGLKNDDIASLMDRDSVTMDLIPPSGTPSKVSLNREFLEK